VKRAADAAAACDQDFVAPVCRRPGAACWHGTAPGGAKMKAGVCAALAFLLAAANALGAEGRPVRLEVPVVHRARERCGPAALCMVLEFYRADSRALASADSAYDPVLRGSLVTDLAERARRAGYPARVSAGDADSLIAWLGEGIPPIILYPRGIGPLTRMHYAVVVGWDPRDGVFALHDGGDRPRTVTRRALDRQRLPADRRVLLVSRMDPGP